jgi:DNA-binding NarL/FixJ family response regulator
MKNKIRIVIADDHPVLFPGLRQAIETDPQFKVIAELTDGTLAVERIAALKPDLAILDIDMPGADGFTIATQIRDRQLAVAIIFFTGHRKESYLQEAVELGVKGYLLKDSTISDILSCLRAVARGEHFTSPAMTSYLVNRAQRATSSPALTDLQSLTPTEREVLRLLAELKTSKEIAGELGMSYRTVETHRHHMIEKLHLEGFHALVKFALAHQAELAPPS